MSADRPERRRATRLSQSRGMLDEILVIWAVQFGKLPTIETRQEKPGRDHNPYWVQQSQ